jgi:hypothetical protein
MSSPANSPYKSRLFGFLNRQSLQIKDRLERTGRQLKVALEWGVQILAYPVYMLVQTGRMAGRQLEKTVERRQLPAASSPEETQQPPISDKPVARVLKAIEPLLSTTLEKDVTPALKDLLTGVGQPLTIPTQDLEILSPISSQSSAIAIRGVASDLETRHLVLIAPNNQVLDILSSQQQKQLQKRIAWEISNYWYECRLQQEAAQKFPELVSSFEQDNENVLPPARLFWKAIRWLQTSQVARAVNLFGESRLVSSDFNRVDNIITFPENPQLAQQLNNHLDNHFNELDHSRSQTANLWNLQKILQAAVDYFFGKQPTQDLPSQDSTSLPASEPHQKNILPPAVRDRVPNLVRKLQINLNSSQKSSSAPETAEPDPFQIQTIIQAALDYFFGQPQEQVSLSGKKTSKGISSRQSQKKVYLPQKQPNSALPASLEDPWLSWDDLYTEETVAEIGDRKANLVPTASAVPVEIRDTRTAQQRQKVSEREQSTAMIASPPEEYSLELDPDWIDAKATPSGYVKHPLVKLLEAIDRIILWLEDLIANFWRWLRRRF